MTTTSSSILTYDLEIPEITYATNIEYRKVFRECFGFNATINEIAAKLLIKPEEVDEESYDELLFDSNIVETQLNLLFDLTYNVPVFKELYMEAAAKMLSLDPLIGQAVLFSYDYFALFHPCLVAYLNNGDIQGKPFDRLFSKIK